MANDELDLDRRSLARTAAAGAALAFGLPLAARAQGMSPGMAMPGMKMDGEENIVFTEDDPGHWPDKVKTHSPEVTVSGNTVTVRTPHPMSPAHFIVSHSVVLDGGRYLGRKTFTPADTPQSTYVLPDGYKGKITATSTCNLHDFWVKSVSV